MDAFMLCYYNNMQVLRLHVSMFQYRRFETEIIKSEPKIYILLSVNFSKLGNHDHQ